MIKAVTGTKDILPSEISSWYHIEEITKKIFTKYNFREIRTPVFESTSLFARGIGEETDIVSKEMYTFRDKGEELLTLRPEMTAPVVRAFIEHSMHATAKVNKLWYFAPMFRQERPQAGRFRQFHQFGAEILGSESPISDCEVILSAWDILKTIGLKNLVIKINSLGTHGSREVYKEKLSEYLQPHFTKLSEESRKRFAKNILRIFDSKEEQDIEIMRNAPLLYEYLDDASRNEFTLVKDILRGEGLQFEEDYRLVRGLDYYTKTTFEIISGSVGSQSAVCGGGRYDNLVKELGGPEIPGVGFAAGVERVLLAAKNENIELPGEKNPDVYIVNLNREAASESFLLAQKLRGKGLGVEYDVTGRSVKAQMREANKFNVKTSIILGGDEAAEGKCTVKDMQSGEQKQVLFSQIVELV